MLADRARECAPNAVLITIGNFLADPALDDLFFQLSTGDPLMTEAVNEETETQTSIDPNILVPEGIILNQKSVTKEEAITAAGQLLTDLGYVDKEYIPLMLERERSLQHILVWVLRFLMELHMMKALFIKQVLY